MYVPGIAPAAACTSLQLHRQVSPEKFATFWNAAQLIAAVDGKIDVLARLDARERDSPIPTIGTVTTIPGTVVTIGASAGSTDPEVDGAGHPKNAVPALFAVAPPRVTWMDAPEGEAVLEVRSDDRIGLLSRVSAILERHGADIRWAKVATLGATGVDIFGLRLATDGIVMESGRVLLTGKADDVLNNPEMAALYFGGSVQEAKQANEPVPMTPRIAPAAG